MKYDLLLVILTFCFLTACNRNSNNAKLQSEANSGGNEVAEKRAEIPPELKEQLKAYGYDPPEKKAHRVRLRDNPYANADIAHLMEGMDATFVFLDLQKDIEIVHNDDRAEKRFSPCSTFKIPNSLIALETGVMQNEKSAIKWDHNKYPKQPFWGVNWDKDHTLKSAYNNSCVWCYMEIAEQIGTDKMQSYVDRFRYGNQDIKSGRSPFWIESSLKISAKEQIVFLKRFVQQELGLKNSTYDEAKRVLERERTPSAVLYAKTGSGDNIGWFVGIVEKQNKHFIFAFNMAGTFKDVAAKRVSVSLSALRELGVWE